jgi:hypothetical protein
MEKVIQKYKRKKIQKHSKKLCVVITATNFRRKRTVKIEVGANARKK